MSSIIYTSKTGQTFTKEAILAEVRFFLSMRKVFGDLNRQVAEDVLYRYVMGLLDWQHPGTILDEMMYSTDELAELRLRIIKESGGNPTGDRRMYTCGECYIYIDQGYDRCPHCKIREIVPMTVQNGEHMIPKEVVGTLDGHDVNHLMYIVRVLKQEYGGEGWAIGDVIQKLIYYLPKTKDGTIINMSGRHQSPRPPSKPSEEEMEATTPHE